MMRKTIRRRSPGVTLVELMIAVAILSIAVLGFVGAFQFITRSLHISRTRTLATNLGQEKIETLKNLSYYELLITTATAPDNNFNPAILYDKANYPPETITIGQSQFIRYTYVALASFNGANVATMTASYPDTGMKEIFSTVVWNDNGTWKKWTLTNLLENPNVAPLDSNMTGTVNSASGGALASAIVSLEGYPDQVTSADANGSFAFHVFHGSYTVRVSSAGYWDVESQRMSAITGSNTTVLPNPLLASQIATGTITGIAWISSAPVISAVMPSSSTCVGVFMGSCVNQNVEYVEFYNPTPNEFDFTTAAFPPTPANFSLYYGGSNNPKDNTSLTYTTQISSYVAPYHYFLLANASFFMLNGQWIHADMVYSGNVMSNDLLGCGSLSFNYASSGIYVGPIDQVGWNGSPCSGGGRPAYHEGPITAIIPTSAGIPAGSQIVRVSSPAASNAQIANWGRAYNSGALYAVNGAGGNNLDFVYPGIAGYTGINFQPLHENSFDNGATTAPLVAAIPAVNAYVSSSDPFSGSTTTQTGFISSGALSLPYAYFNLVKVTTTAATIAANCGGQCWVVDLASGAYVVEYATVPVGHNAPTAAPNANTSPAWNTLTAQPSDVLIVSTGGFVKGSVTDINGNAINGAATGVSVSVNGVTNQLNPDGYYFIKTTTGVATVVANPNFTTPYVQVIAMPNVTMGNITTQNFILSQGGSITGNALNSSGSALPNYTFVATQGGAQMGSAVSNFSGQFIIQNLSTGTYVVAPTLDSSKTSSPNNATVIVSTAGTYSAGSFTISGAMGTLTGTVKLNNNLVTTGALILASSATWPASVFTVGPSAIVGSSAPALSNPIYAISSLADGTYSLNVRGGYNYNMLIYIPSVNINGTVTVTTGTPVTQATVNAGASATYNFSQ